MSRDQNVNEVRKHHFRLAGKFDYVLTMPAIIVLAYSKQLQLFLMLLSARDFKATGVALLIDFINTTIYMQIIFLLATRAFALHNITLY
jgi:hypothetical protein